ncbi:MAG: T9SS type A sorting domain-containing protein [Candidatus Marinimicrobia bacterium]|nr:T9SS type A sorting domain-containing protein [Candidatus Neomarinimicrobiota bacterium]MBT3576229.1 T9SS type A sorting domain-containing protein [Candidatus Neomarinimicrobiota bacterium]MBT3680772.1 T9SS type A sorting domain-containing protein [Candidatus Neomarinimicrobiota bacterium]MBT3950779.1 T9SS type A sorting domain-containing protein [Candidatus Neomarinimicrobiota bacterium]MBT4252357.1 T9SS type A sorting domain-containing protein [Candidatus Neomarinimicrobiota bacterium]
MQIRKCLLFLFMVSAYGQVDTTFELSFFPLHVGDKWEYRGTHGNYDDGSSSPSYFTLEIYQDTIFDGYQYYEHSAHGYLRIDTTEMMVYQLDFDTALETPFWDLVLEPGEQHPNGHVYEGIDGPFNFWGTGVSSYEKHYNNGQIIINEESYSYVSNIGFYDLNGLSHGGWYWSDDLIAVRIDSTQYGTFSYPEDTLSGGFTPHIIYAYADGVNSVYSIDLDDDGDVDVLSASMNDNTIAWYENNGDENFNTHVITAEVDGASSVYATDVDNDGDLDVLSASFDDDIIAWHENDGTEGFSSHIISTYANGASSVYASDIDDDGNIDILSASTYDNKIQWHENTGEASFLSRIVTAAADRASSVYAADVDGDGDVDILSSSIYDSKIAWYENVGGFQFPMHIISSDAIGASSVHACDVDGDGDMDVLSASMHDDEIRWYENDGMTEFSTHVISSVANGASSVFAADMDNDGDMDVLSASSVDSKIAWYENDGQGEFLTHVLTYDSNGASSIHARDIDGDGDMDILSASKGSDRIAWYENLTVTGVTNSINTPNDSRLEQNYPNPFNPSTSIRFDVKETGHVILEIFDILGRSISKPVDTELLPGQYSVQLFNSYLNSGVYLYQIQMGDYIATKKMVVNK